MLFGISVFYGLFGSTNYALISQYITNNPVNVLTLTISILLVFTGFGLKLFTFPFQSVFTKISSGIDFANLSVILTTSVIAGSGAFVRFVNTAFYDSLAFISANNSHTLSPAFNWELFLTIIFCTSILSSAFLLYLQKDFIKIILYYLLINLQFVIITGFEKSSQGISNYLMNIVFILASVIGTSYVTNYFYTVHSVKELKDIRGMFRRSPAPLIFLIVMLLSICGLPLTMGFTIRIYIFSEINQSFGIFIIIASAIAAFICLLIVYRILISAITSVEDSPQILKLNAGQMILPILILIIMFLFGLLPDLLTNFFRFIAIS
jgi:NADH-quinone oxidoreductase subunit N